MPILLIVIALVVVVVGGFAFMNKDSATVIADPAPVVTPTSSANTTPAPTPAAPVVETNATATINQPKATTATKSFTSKIDYDSPAQAQESVTVTMSVENGVITKVSNVYNDGKDQNPYQKRFDGTYQSLVVGKKLEDISLSRVGGASLTSQAFNKAVAGFIAQS